MPQLYCGRCQRYFTSQNGLRSHLENSAAHKHTYCKPCERDFTSYDSRRQHYVNNSAHEDTYCARCDEDFEDSEDYDDHFASSDEHHYCAQCDRDFDDNEELTDHLLRSYSHHYCEKCEEDFDDEEDLDDHLATSSEHHYCRKCERDFVNAVALEQHYTNSGAHNYCVMCQRDFATHIALGQHRENAAIHMNSEARENANTDWWCESESESESNSDWQPQLSRAIAASYTQFHAPEAQTQTNHAISTSHSRSHESTAHTQIRSTGSEHRCPLCLDHSEDLSSVKCGHVFCTPYVADSYTFPVLKLNYYFKCRCIRRALNERQQCPFCRRSAVLSDLRKTFFNFWSYQLLVNIIISNSVPAHLLRFSIYIDSPLIWPSCITYFLNHPFAINMRLHSYWNTPCSKSWWCGRECGLTLEILNMRLILKLERYLNGLRADRGEKNLELGVWK